jgi:hypothetical protein
MGLLTAGVAAGFLLSVGVAAGSHGSCLESVLVCEQLNVRLDDLPYFRTHFGKHNYALFWYEANSKKWDGRRPGRAARGLANAWNERGHRVLFDEVLNSFQAQRRKYCRPYSAKSWCNASYVIAHAARVLNATIFLHAPVTRSTIAKYNSNTPLAYDPVVGAVFSVFCSIEYLVLRDLAVHVIDTPRMAKYCQRHTPDECIRCIQVFGNLPVHDVCANVDPLDVAARSTEHSEYWCPRSRKRRRASSDAMAEPRGVAVVG